MPSLEIQSQLARAQQAYGAGDLDRALTLAESVIAEAPRLAAARQIAAIVERRRGRPEAAERHFEAALQSAPNDPHILNSYANLLAERGDWAGARAHYRQALACDPGHVDALVNLGLAAKRLGELPEALSALERATLLAPENVRSWQALGVLLMEQGRLEEASETLIKARELAPRSPAVLRALAQVELGQSLALYARGASHEAQRRLERLVADTPGFEAAHAAFARVRWQNGDNAGFADSYETALRAEPTDPELWAGYFAVLMRAGRPDAVLARLDAARPALGAGLARFEAAAATEAGDLERADRAFARAQVSGDPALELSHLRHLLRCGRAHEVATEALQIVQREDGHAAWPYLATAWRMTDEARWRWLEGDPAFIGSFDLPLTEQELAQLAAGLRSHHHAQAAPFDQTVRGGTQTEGDLFSFRSPEIARLQSTLRAAINDYLSHLPPSDPTHPLLKHRGRAFEFAGAWSVRLTASGFHVNHVHTTGWISSACYISLPQDLGLEPRDLSGWLTFGEPPAELGLDLPPFRLLQPRVGRLALFPSTLWHGTRPFRAGERLTVAFDLAPAPDRERIDHAP